jgi:dynein heavy chain
MEEELAAMQRQFDEMQAELDELQKNYDRIMAQLEEFVKEITKLSLAIDRGEQLVSGLSGEKTRWTASQLMYEEISEKLVGDCLMAAGLISFMGPYPNNYREEITKEIRKCVKDAKIDHDPDFQFAKFMTTDAQIREWQVKELPTDDFSTQNAVVISKSNKWCTIIDPQSQAKTWIIKKTGKSLNRIDFKNAKYGTLIERAVSNGKTTLLEDVGESLDPTLVNILSKNYFGPNAKKRKVQVGDREIDWAPKFSLVLTTRIANPTFSDMITQATTIVNFCVTEFALEEQCLNIVIQIENANLETNRIESVKKIADNNAKLQKLEDDILASLNNDSGIPLLEDVELIQTLNTAKDASDEAKSQAEGLKIAMKKIMENREMYRPIAKKASALYFVLFELNVVDAMYQFSLAWYKDLFQKSIAQAPEGPQQERAKAIVNTHTLNVYRQACRTLFERHKLLLSLQMCIKLMMAEGLIDAKEYSFFLRGGTVLQRDGQPVRPPGA